MDGKLTLKDDLWHLLVSETPEVKILARCMLALLDQVNTLRQFSEGVPAEPNTPSYPEYLEKNCSPFERHVLRTLRKLEETTMATKSGLQRVQEDSAALQQQVTDLQTAQQTQGTALLAAQARMQADIDALRQAAGSGNEAALLAVADQMDTTLGVVKSVTDALNASATAEAGVDPTPVNTPPPSTGVTISPATAALAPSATQAFTASQAVSWSAQNGSIDANGNYTAPPQPGTDTVTATPTDGSAAATATITVG